MNPPVDEGDAPDALPDIALRRLATIPRQRRVSRSQADAAFVARQSVPGAGAFGRSEIAARAALVDLLRGLDVSTLPHQSGATPAGVELAGLLSVAALPGVGDLPDLAPGPRLAGLLSHIMDGTGRPTAAGSLSSAVHGGLRSLTEYSLVEVAAACDRMTSWAAAVQAEALAVLAARQVVPTLPDGVVSSSTSSEGMAGRLVAPRLGVSPHTGEQRVRGACQLTRSLPGTMAALRAGTITTRHARVICDETARLDSDLARRVEEKVLPRTSRLSPAKLRAAITKIVGTEDPAGAEARFEHAASRRDVWSSPLPDGMSEVCATMPAGDAAAVMATLDAAAAAMKAADPADKRTMAQRRADALAALGWNALHAGHLGGPCSCDGASRQTLAKNRGGRPASVVVMVAATTLLGLDDLPGELAGYGPIPASVARTLAGDGTWRRLLTDPATGAPVDYGITRYRPPADLVELVKIRDRTCRFPGCNQPAHRCQVDHTVPAARGGPTRADDLGPLCQPCHLAKTHTGWRVEQSAPGRFEWIDPTGHQYVVEPEPVGPVHSGDPPDPDPPPF